MARLPDPADQWWTTTDVAVYINARPATVSSYRARQQMPPAEGKFGRTWVWSPATIMRWRPHGICLPRRSHPVGGQLWLTEREMAAVITAVKLQEVMWEHHGEGARVSALLAALEKIRAANVRPARSGDDPAVTDG